MKRSEEQVPLFERNARRNISSEHRSSYLAMASAATSATPDGAIPLLSQQGEQIALSKEAVGVLCGIKEPLTIVAVAGLYRTGKSFLLNSLVERRGTFNVGTTTDACTRGVWLYDTGKTVNGGRLLFLDSEGLASLDQDENYDAKIFCLSLLLSSYFILNSLGVIDEGAIDRLFLVTELTKRVTVAAGQADSERSLGSYFPPFLWCLRDFVLNLEHNGKPISRNEYLENALEEKSSKNRRADERNDIRRSIKSLFSSRTCYTMVRPSNDEKQMRKEGGLLYEDLRPEFIEQLEELRGIVLENSRTKQMNGCAVNGPMLVNLANTYVDAMNNGAVPEIRGAWESCVLEMCRDSYSAAMVEYTRLLGEGLKPAENGRTLSLDGFNELVLKCEKAGFAKFEKLIVSGPGKQKDEYAIRLRDAMQNERGRAFTGLEHTSIAYCQSVAGKTWKKCVTSQPITEDSVDSFSMFADVYESFLVCYESDASGELAFERVLNEFLKENLVNLFRRFFEVAATKSDKLRSGLDQRLKGKEEEVKNLKLNIEREVSRSKEAAVVSATAIQALETQLKNMEEQKRAMVQLHKEEIAKRQEQVELRREKEKELRAEKNARREVEEKALALRRQVDDARMSVASERQKRHDLLDECTQEYEVQNTMNRLLHSVEMLGVASQNQKSLQRLEEELGRSSDERAAVSVQLRDFMEKVSALPEIYQRVVFCNNKSGSQIDFYDAVAGGEDDDGGSISSWFGFGS